MCHHQTRHRLATSAGTAMKRRLRLSDDNTLSENIEAPGADARAASVSRVRTAHPLDLADGLSSRTTASTCPTRACRRRRSMRTTCVGLGARDATPSRRGRPRPLGPRSGSRGNGRTAARSGSACARRILDARVADPGNRESQLRTDSADAQAVKSHNCPAERPTWRPGRRSPLCHSPLGAIRSSRAFEL